MLGKWMGRTSEIILKLETVFRVCERKISLWSSTQEAVVKYAGNFQGGWLSKRRELEIGHGERICLLDSSKHCKSRLLISGRLLASTLLVYTLVISN